MNKLFTLFAMLFAVVLGASAKADIQGAIDNLGGSENAWVAPQASVMGVQNVIDNSDDNENKWIAIQSQIANVQAAIDNFDAEVAKMKYASRCEGEEFIGAVDAAREWVETTTETYKAKYEAGELTAEDGVKGEMMEQVQAVNEALNAAAKYDINRYVQAVVYYWMGDDEDIIGKSEFVYGVMESMAGPGKAAFEEQVTLLETAIQGLLNDWEAYALYSEANHNALIEKAEYIKADIADIVAQAEETAAIIANNNAWAAIQNQIANVQAAIDNFVAEVAKMKYASRYEGEDIVGAVDAAREWVTATTETYKAKYEAGELTAEDGVKGEMMEQVQAVNEALNAAAYYDIYRYVQAVYYNWFGNEEGVVGKRAYVESVMEKLSTAGKSALEEQVGLLDKAISSTLTDKMFAYAQYSAETHQALIDEAETLQENIAEVVAQAEEAEKAVAIDNAWAAIQNQIANVQAAIDNFVAEVAKMKYASRYEGEEVIGAVDAAREWVTATTETYKAKYEAGELTAEDGVKGEMMEQVQAVNEALNNAAKYDANRYVQAVVYAWLGDEEDIKGYSEGVAAIVAALPEAGQSALNEQIVLMETAMQQLLNDIEAYSLYTEETHKAIIDKVEAIMSNMKDLVSEVNLCAAQSDMERLEAMQAQMTAAIKDNEPFLTPDDVGIIETFLGDTYMIMIQGAYYTCEQNGTLYESPIRWSNLEAILNDMTTWLAICNQINIVKEALRNYDEIVSTFMYASRYEGEELTELVDAAREWVETKTAELGAKHQACLLTAEDGVRGEAMEQAQNVNEALNLAAMYDAGRYVQATVYAWAGNGEDIQGYSEGVAALIATLPVAGQSALNEQIVLMETAMQQLMVDLEAYTLYTEDTHNAIIEKSQAIMSNMKDLVSEVNLSAAQLDMDRLEALQEQMTAAIKDNESFLTPDDVAIIETFLGDTYMIMIGAAYEECVENGTLYVSPMQWDNLETILSDMTVWLAICNQINIAKEALRNYDEIVSTFKYASRYEGEELTELVDAAREWVETKTAELGAKHQAGTLTIDDSVKGEAMEQAQNVAEALHLAALYDAGRYTEAAMNYWYGNEDQDIKGVREDIMAMYSNLSVAAQSVLDERIQYIELTIKDMFTAWDCYTAYTAEYHAQFPAWYETVVADVADLIPAANKANFETDMALLSQLQKEYLLALEYIPEDYRDVEAFAAIDKTIKDLAYAADSQYKNLGQGEVYVSVVDYDAIIGEITAQMVEYDRQVANLYACMADMELLEVLQKEWSDYIRGMEPVLSHSDVEFSMWLLGDELVMTISDAYEKVAKEGVYESVIDADAIRAQMAEHAAAIELVRLPYNQKAYEADQKAIARLQNEFNNALNRIVNLYPGGSNIEAEDAMQQKIYALSDACDQEYEDKLDAKLYETQVTEEVYDEMIAAFAKMVEDAKNLDGIEGIGAIEADSTVYTVNGAKVQNPVRGQIYIIKSKDGVKKIRY